ncbi:MAG UNVERIFIED_CONTAM: PQQ-binding-like beta-propeller repeat protein [Anaerolineae bacterium]
MSTSRRWIINSISIKTETGEVDDWTIDLGGAATATPVYDDQNKMLYVAGLSGDVYAVSFKGDILE